MLLNHSSPPKAAAKWKRAERPDAYKKASQKWRESNPDKVRKGMETANAKASIRTWRIALLALLLMCSLQRVEGLQKGDEEHVESWPWLAAELATCRRGFHRVAQRVR